MSFTLAHVLPPRQSRPRKPVTFVARDEQQVRRRLQAAHHRPPGEAWAASILRIRARHLRRVSRWLEKGIIDQRMADRLTRCTPPNSTIPRQRRRYCEHPACPYCHYRRLLSVYRAVWHEVCAPELERRQSNGAASRRGRTRLALGRVVVEVPSGEAACERVRELTRNRVVRKIQRAGGIQDGLATISVNRSKEGYRIIISVLGLTDTAVQRIQPQGPRSRGMRDLRTDWAIEWKAAVSGHDAPKFGPRSLLRLLTVALPVGVDDTGMRLKRFQPLGDWRRFLHARPADSPRPICFRSNRRAMEDEWTWSADDQRIARLERCVVRALLKRLSRGADLSDDQTNMIVGRYINVWKGSEFTPPLSLSTWVRDQLEVPVLFIPHDYYLHRIDGFVPPAAEGGRAWQAITARLDMHLDPSECLVMRPPGRTRGAVVAHGLPEAERFGRCERIGGTRLFLQHLDAFLEFLMAIWPDRPTDFCEIIDRAA